MLPPTPAPSSSPAPAAHLKTIATVRSTPRCTAILRNANGAIVVALNGDRQLAATIAQMNHAPLNDGNLLHRVHAIQAMVEEASALAEGARRGQGEINALRHVAATTPDKAQKKAVLAFANALGGAIGRQAAVARDLSGFTAYLQAKDSRRDVFDPGLDDELPLPNEVEPLGYQTDAQLAQNAAQDFQKRLTDIARDEATAADDAGDALSGC